MAGLRLSRRDIQDIARVVETEVPGYLSRTNPAEYRSMVEAVVDTITNRAASPSFPNSIRDVVNQNRQFSKIAGPKSLDPYGSVQAAPPASPGVFSMVESHLKGRELGQPSPIGGATHYANPHYSDVRNLTGWIEPMMNAGAQPFGVGKAVHYHGVAPGFQPVDPYEIDVVDFSIPTPSPAPRPNAPVTPVETKNLPSPAAMAYAPNPSAQFNTQGLVTSKATPDQMALLGAASLQPANNLLSPVPLGPLQTLTPAAPPSIVSPVTPNAVTPVQVQPVQPVTPAVTQPAKATPAQPSYTMSTPARDPVMDRYGLSYDDLDKAKSAAKNADIAGLIAGGLLGGVVVGGPIGMALGAKLGKNIAGRRMDPRQAFLASYIPNMPFPVAPAPPANRGHGGLTQFGSEAAAGMHGAQAEHAANNPGGGLW